LALVLGCAATATPRAADAPKPVQITEGRPAMGTVLEITLVASDEATARAAIERCYEEIERLERILTTWREDGELARLNARAGRGAQQASPELIGILLDARGFERETDGAFDVTVGPLMRLWRDAEVRGAPPDEAALARARALTGGQRIEIDPRQATVALPAGAAIDLGGIAKGWALDRLGELLRSAGLDRALLNFGGSSLLALGRPTDRPEWRVQVGEGPVLNLRNVSVSVSESFGQSFEIAGERFGHIVDPRSGRSITRKQRAIVLAGNGATAEAWSTALIVLPPDAGIARAMARGEISARVDDGSELLAETPAFYLDADATSASQP
jgi:thiamine biosynthesis lipoprotein